MGRSRGVTNNGDEDPNQRSVIVSEPFHPLRVALPRLPWTTIAPEVASSFYFSFSLFVLTAEECQFERNRFWGYHAAGSWLFTCSFELFAPCDVIPVSSSSVAPHARIAK